MATRNRFIAPERMGAWLMVTLGVAILALIVAIFGVKESRTGSMVTQVQLLKLDERVKALEARGATASTVPPAPAAAEPAK